MLTFKYKVKINSDIIRVNLLYFLVKIFTLGKIQPDDDQAITVYYSERYDLRFNSFHQYWSEVGKKETLAYLIAANKDYKARAYKLEEALVKLSTHTFGTGTGVILYDVHPQLIGKLYPHFKDTSLAMLLKEDFIFIPTKSREEARKFVDKISYGVASVIAVDNGIDFATNVEFEAD